MTTLTVTARGQVTFRKDVLNHLGIKPGDKIEVDLLPDGRGVIRAAQPAASISDFVGLLAGRTTRIASLEEMDAAITKGWSGEK
ncbi:AbrB/MazE/SpoVT family DNA-binding domain-containing protein [Asticcacaulis sp. YBE204]|uniref:AbrB/MazE/SpoVT family DNA-binding domain-containing protein n=1 Tax=Asticcacaulis sp. YBE204 TaxID=1282363 RepID=UPI0003C3BD71|nr:AbrB/MazE/SpoVT family DNA-binding domain-containing protein [Asticcacaulis sp. YBE204]ESQ80964.1 transcriptional regulator [Asticcacaulis sp. YBE204]